MNVRAHTETVAKHIHPLHFLLPLLRHFHRFHRFLLLHSPGRLLQAVAQKEALPQP